MAREITSVPFAPANVQFHCSIKGTNYNTEGNEKLVRLRVEGDGGQAVVVMGSFVLAAMPRQ